MGKRGPLGLHFDLSLGTLLFLSLRGLVQGQNLAQLTEAQFLGQRGGGLRPRRPQVRVRGPLIARCETVPLHGENGFEDEDGGLILTGKWKKNGGRYESLRCE